MARVLTHFRALLKGMTLDEEVCLSQLSLLDAQERHRLVVNWNDTSHPLAEQFDLTAALENQAARRPEALALCYGSNHFSYLTLHQRTNQIARQLAALGVGPEKVVALIAERNGDYWLFMIAILKAGGVYLPLDPFQPAARQRLILEQAGVHLILTQGPMESELHSQVSALGMSQPPLIRGLASFRDESIAVTGTTAFHGPENLAYVIYTSGSTGTPKGAMIAYLGMFNHLFAKNLDAGICQSDVVAQSASQTFDISVWQCLSPLLKGAVVRVLGDEALRNPMELLEQVDATGVTVLELVPSQLQNMVDEIAQRDGAQPRATALRWILCQGETLSPKLCRQWLALYPRPVLLNGWGITELSDDVLHWPLESAPAEEVVSIPVGRRPLPNMRLYILDRHLEPVPIGVAGEIFVAGIGVGRGYLKAPARTAAIFIPDPFSENGGERLYKTGDLARYRNDGAVDFIGRRDFQLKLRGFRIELGEIEAALTRHPLVEEAVVVVWDPVGDGNELSKQLAAYVRPKTGGELPLVELPNQLRQDLLETLPDVMVPALVTIMDAFPLNTNGKVDRAALPEPKQVGRGAAYQAPRTAYEVKIAQIWAEVLHVEQVSVDDNFFDLGGHSLLITKVVSRIQLEYNVKIPLLEAFQNPDLASFAKKVEKLCNLVKGFQAPTTTLTENEEEFEL